MGGGSATGGGSAMGGGSATGGGSASTTTLRIHYPAGNSIAVRGSGGGLNWNAGMATLAAGNVYTATLTGLTSPIEWKPLLTDTTWARGPNYRASPGATVDIWPHFTTIQGQVVTLVATFHSTLLNNDRPIYAYLPPSYDENPGATYPVVYMHDGQNLWASHPEWAAFGTWNVDSAFDFAAEHGTCAVAPDTMCTGDGDCSSGHCQTFPEAIVIGVANDAQRIYEYTPTTDPGTPGGGGADLYLRMLVEELKPQVDMMLRTRTDVASTTLSGSSLGGLVSAYGGLTKPTVFGRVAAFSPSSWWNNGVLITDIMGTMAAPNRPLIVYVDSGSGSADDEVDTDALAAAYLGLGYTEGTDFHHVVQDGGMHNESYWAQRFPGAMQFVLGVR
jgi:predicted alpha/beta superfamily hydrolase